jgi:hypothetical protein
MNAGTTAPAARLQSARGVGEPPAAMTALRRPLFVALMLGCGVSMIASGRFTLRLVVDGTISFAFVPACELLAFAIVYAVARRAGSFAADADRFFASDVAWLWWMLLLMVAAAIIPAHRSGVMDGPFLVTLPIPFVITAVKDYRLFHREWQASSAAAVSYVTLSRVVGWTAGTLYFLGIASTRRDFFYLFVEIGEAITTWVRYHL